MTARACLPIVGWGSGEHRRVSTSRHVSLSDADWERIEPLLPTNGLTSKIHAAVDGNGRPLALVVTGGQRNAGVMLAEVMADIRVPRVGRGRPRTRPEVVVADRAYTSGINRAMLARRGVKAVVPQKTSEIRARKRKGSAGGRPPAFDAEIYTGRNVVERSFNLSKQWRGLATRYDKLAITFRAAAVLQACIRCLRLLRDTP